MSSSYTALHLDMQRNVVSGSPEALRQAIRNGADLRIYTEFRHNEHIDESSYNNEMIREVSDFPATYLVDNRWVAGIMTLRQPVTLPDRFGDRASMSFFMYNENGQQAVARPFLDGQPLPPAPPIPAAPTVHPAYPDTMGGRYHTFGRCDDNTNGPSMNFIYDFYNYKFLVRDDWKEIYAHDADGNPTFGSATALDEASNAGMELKVAISGICDGLWGQACSLPHELFIEAGPHYYYDETGYMVVETRPFVRVMPQIPMVYDTCNWDFGWAIVRSDGHVAGLYYDPYTLQTRRTFSRHAVRWFAR